MKNKSKNRFTDRIYRFTAVVLKYFSSEYSAENLSTICFLNCEQNKIYSFLLFSMFCHIKVLIFSTIKSEPRLYSRRHSTLCRNFRRPNAFLQSKLWFYVYYYIAAV